MSNITYDSAGLCTRCGSTGWEAAITALLEHPHDRVSVTPCPCHGWRPIDFAPVYAQVLVGARYASGTPSQWQTAKAWLEGERCRWMLANREPAAIRVPFAPTHWQHLPQPLETV